MNSRLVSLVAVLAIVAGMTSGCLAQPEPEPTPAFASEEEAFAAAEATYRAYVDAVNGRREDPSSTPDPADFLIGSALEAHISTQQQFDQANVVITGASGITRLEGEVADLSEMTVTISVCLDSSHTRVIDESGADATPADRPTETPLSVELVVVGDSLLIETSNATVDGC